MTKIDKDPQTDASRRTQAIFVDGDPIDLAAVATNPVYERHAPTDAVESNRRGGGPWKTGIRPPRPET